MDFVIELQTAILDAMTFTNRLLGNARFKFYDSQLIHSVRPLIIV